MNDPALCTFNLTMIEFLHNTNRRKKLTTTTGRVSILGEQTMTQITKYFEQKHVSCARQSTFSFCIHHDCSGRWHSILYINLFYG